MTLSDLDITHFFVGDKFAKVTRIEPGIRLTQHVHRFDHYSALLAGDVLLTVNGTTRALTGPTILTIRAGQEHEVEAVTEALWVCLWDANGATEPEQVDEAVIA